VPHQQEPGLPFAGHQQDAGRADDFTWDSFHNCLSLFVILMSITVL
jgi:hypothetical protein